ncbi:HNH endonuclease signature motif containing protein [Streptomyces sp. NPDC057235]|uniref:HNH endonuclease signature motif containing protein n=1 Tax=Streptomyces sp. NPDC057235 TaxID=3346058 RepID=UPI003624FBB2
MRKSPTDRFLSHVDQSNGHWLWTGAINPNGYGYFSLGGRAGKSVTAHRAAHVLFIGPIPEGAVVDHLCRVKRCVNPAHLEAVTQKENMRRGNASIAVALSNRRRGEEMTHCRKGHEYTVENTKYEARKGNRRPSRRCIECQKAGYRRRKYGE